MAVTLVVQHAGELPRDRVGVVSQLAPREAHDPPAGDHELAVLGTVVFEGLTRAVCGEAVALDDEAVVRPGGVDLAAIGEPVDLRSRELVGVDESEEVAFEDARWDRLAVLAVVVEEALDRSRPAASGVARDEGIERSWAREAADLRFLERRFEVLRRDDRGESSSVRAGVVTGMPASMVTSSVRIATSCSSMRAVLRRRRGTLTSIRAREPLRIDHSSAAER
jgi:hypothetical protein